MIKYLNPNKYYHFGLEWTWSNGNEGVLHILQSSRNGTSPSDGLVSYSGYIFGESLQRCSPSQLRYHAFVNAQMMMLVHNYK